MKRRLLQGCVCFLAVGGLILLLGSLPASANDGDCGNRPGFLRRVVQALGFQRPPSPDAERVVNYRWEEVTDEELRRWDRGEEIPHPRRAEDAEQQGGYRDAAARPPSAIIRVRMPTGHYFRRVVVPEFAHLGASWIDETMGLRWDPPSERGISYNRALEIEREVRASDPQLRLPTPEDFETLQAHLGSADGSLHGLLPGTGRRSGGISYWSSSVPYSPRSYSLTRIPGAVGHASRSYDYGYIAVRFVRASQRD